MGILLLMHILVSSLPPIVNRYLVARSLDSSSPICALNGDDEKNEKDLSFPSHYRDALDHENTFEGCRERF